MIIRSHIWTLATHIYSGHSLYWFFCLPDSYCWDWLFWIAYFLYVFFLSKVGSVFCIGIFYGVVIFYSLRSILFDVGVVIAVSPLPFFFLVLGTSSFCFSLFTRLLCAAYAQSHRTQDMLYSYLQILARYFSGSCRTILTSSFTIHVIYLGRQSELMHISLRCENYVNATHKQPCKKLIKHKEFKDVIKGIYYCGGNSEIIPFHDV